MRKIFVLLWFFCGLSGYAQTGTEQADVRHFNSGVEYCSQGEYKIATAAFSQAIMINPNNADYYSWRGEGYYWRAEMDALRLGENRVNTAAYKSDNEQAVKIFETALRLNPNHTNAGKNLPIARRRAAGSLPFAPPIPGPGPRPGEELAPPPGW